VHLRTIESLICPILVSSGIAERSIGRCERERSRHNSNPASLEGQQRGMIRTHVEVRGDRDARFHATFTKTLRGLRRTVWSHPILLLAYAALFEEVRRTPKNPPRRKSKVVARTSDRLALFRLRSRSSSCDLVSDTAGACQASTRGSRSERPDIALFRQIRSKPSNPAGAAELESAAGHDGEHRHSRPLSVEPGNTGSVEEAAGHSRSGIWPDSLFAVTASLSREPLGQLQQMVGDNR
jgi:hypothetical protein